MTGSQFIKLIDELSMNEHEVALLAGIPMYKTIAMARVYQEEPLEFHHPLISHLTVDILSDLQWIVNEIDGEEAKKQLGEFLSNELHTRGAGYVAWWILNFRQKDRSSWTGEDQT